MNGQRVAGLALVALVALVAAALVAASVLMPRPWAATIGAAGDAYLISNAFPPEQSGELPLRWTRDVTRLTPYGAYPGPVVLELRLYRDPAGTAGQPWPLAVRHGAAPPITFAATPGWRRYALALPPGAVTGPLSLSGPTFKPAGSDARELGVALAELRVVPLAGATPWGYALRRALWLGCLLALAGAATWLLDAWTIGPSGAPGRFRRALALTTGLGVSLAAWAWLDPRSFAWALPTRWTTVAWLAALLGVAGVLAAQRPTLARLPARLAGRLGGRLGWATALLLAHGALLAPMPALVTQAAALALLLAPGALAALALTAGDADLAEQGFLAVAGGIGVAALLVLGLHALPGALPWWLLLLAADGLSLLGLWAWGRQPEAPLRAAPRPQQWLLLPMLVAVTMRLWGLGTAQFQGDEAYAMLLARGVMHGQQDVLLVHLKGPLEALLPAGPLALSGTISELTARLPFTLASLALIAGVWALAGRLFGGRAGDVAGFVAALGLAADGLLLAFGRIVQYQSLVLLLSAAALWLCWRFATGAPARRYLPAAAFCAAGAVLAHYDGIYVAPALAWLVVAGGLRRGWRPAAWARALAPAVAVGLLLSLSFYLPFVRHEHFASTLSHLETRSGQRGALVLYNNLAGYAELLSVYATRYVAAAMGLGLLAVLAALLLAAVRPRLLGAALAAMLVVGALIGALAPELAALGPDASWVGLLVVPPLVALALAPRLPGGTRVLVLWGGGALVAHAFLLADPRTHFYTAHPASWLLIGLGAAWLWLRAAAAPLVRRAMAAGGTALLGLSLAYSGMVFLRPWPEYERAFPATLLPFFRPLGGEVLPDDGLFAFPARDGWKTAALLFSQGVLRGSQDSNQKLFIPGWYLRGQFRCQVNPDYFLTANGATPLYIPPGYHHFGSVMVDGVRALEIYSRAPVTGPPQFFNAADYAAAHDAASVPNFPFRRLLTGVVPQTRSETPWRDGFALRGFDLDRSDLAPGGVAFITLYWRASQPLPATLQPTVLIRDMAGGAVGEVPGYCSGMPAEVWQRNYMNDTAFRLEAASLAPGVYTLHAAVRDQASGVLLPLAAGGDSLPLATITVRGP